MTDTNTDVRIAPLALTDDACALEVGRAVLELRALAARAVVLERKAAAMSRRVEGIADILAGNAETPPDIDVRIHAEWPDAHDVGALGNALREARYKRCELLRFLAVFGVAEAAPPTA